MTTHKFSSFANEIKDVKKILKNKNKNKIKIFILCSEISKFFEYFLYYYFYFESFIVLIILLEIFHSIINNYNNI